jgi:hypothetical protein
MMIHLQAVLSLLNSLNKERKENKSHKKTRDLRSQKQVLEEEGEEITEEGVVEINLYHKFKSLNSK